MTEYNKGKVYGENLINWINNVKHMLEDIEVIKKRV